MATLGIQKQDEDMATLGMQNIRGRHGNIGYTKHKTKTWQHWVHKTQDEYMATFGTQNTKRIHGNIGYTKHKTNTW